MEDQHTLVMAMTKMWPSGKSWQGNGRWRGFLSSLPPWEVTTPPWEVGHPGKPVPEAKNNQQMRRTLEEAVDWHVPWADDDDKGRRRRWCSLGSCCGDARDAEQRTSLNKESTTSAIGVDWRRLQCRSKRFKSHAGATGRGCQRRPHRTI